MRSLFAIILSTVDIAALAILLVFIVLFLFFTLRARGGRRFELRPIATYRRLRELVSQATESGRPMQVSMGAGRIGSEATPEALMGLTAFEYVAQHAATCDNPTQGVTGDGTMLASAEGILQKARREAGFTESYRGYEVHYYGPEGMTYAAGALDTLRTTAPLGNLLLGPHGAEGLWVAEAGRAGGIPQLGGTADPAAAALLRLALDESPVGEEVYAAGAYLHRASHLGSLATQDLVRIVIVVAIIVGILLTSLGIRPSLAL